MAEDTPTASSSKRRAPSRQSHACSLCSKVFSRAEYVRRHYFSKHSLKAIECDKCNATFSRKDLLVRHARIFHAGSAVPKAPPPPRDVDFPTPIPVSDGTARPADEGADEDDEAEGQRRASSASPARSDETFGTSLFADAEVIGSLNALSDAAAGAADGGESAPPRAPSSSPSRSRSTKRARVASPEIAVDVPDLSLPVLSDNSLLLDLPLNPDPQPPFEPNDEAFAAFLRHVAPAPDSFEATDLSFAGLALPDSILPALPTPTALVATRPRNWAVHALPGDEEEWDEEDATGIGELQRIGYLRMERVKEPCVWPDHLFIERRSNGSRFFMPSQRFCIAYLYPWEIPSLPRLSRFAAQAYVSLLPLLPLVHRPTLSMTELAPPFAFALSVVGAGLFESSADFHRTLSHAKRDFAAEHLAEVIVHEQERMPRVQTLLLYQLVGAFSNSHEEREYTRQHHPQLIHFRTTP